MRWIARISVFVSALVLGTFVASLFWVESPQEVTSVTWSVPPPPPPVMQLAPASTPISAESLLGKWSGAWGRDSDNCTIEIDRVKGNAFSGTLREEDAVVRFEGTFDPNTRTFTFNETKVVSLGSYYDEWSLGKNSGFISPDGQTLVGTGHDKWGWYGWQVKADF